MSSLQNFDFDYPFVTGWIHVVLLFYVVMNSTTESPTAFIPKKNQSAYLAPLHIYYSYINMGTKLNRKTNNSNPRERSNK